MPPSMVAARAAWNVSNNFVRSGNVTGGLENDALPVMQVMTLLVNALRSPSDNRLKPSATFRLFMSTSFRFIWRAIRQNQLVRLRTALRAGDNASVGPMKKKNQPSVNFEVLLL